MIGSFGLIIYYNSLSHDTKPSHTATSSNNIFEAEAILDDLSFEFNV